MIARLCNVSLCRTSRTCGRTGSKKLVKYGAAGKARRGASSAFLNSAGLDDSDIDYVMLSYLRLTDWERESCHLKIATSNKNRKNCQHRVFVLLAYCLNDQGFTRKISLPILVLSFQHLFAQKNCYLKKIRIECPPVLSENDFEGPWWS